MNQDLVSQLAQLPPSERRMLLQRVQRLRTGDSTAIPRRERTGAVVPASFAQERLWFLWRLAPGSATYHVPWAYEVSGGLDAGLLGVCVGVLAERFEVLRSVLEERDGVIVQRVGAPGRWALAAEPAGAG